MSGTIFSSSTSQHRWVDQLSDHFIVFIENPPSIFRVPNSILDTNPEAYAPQEIGIGPYHHFRHDLDDMESRKLAAIKTFLRHEQLQNFKSLVVDKVRAMEPSIRSCYDKYLDLDGDTLAWAMAIDGVFLLHLLTAASPNAGKLLRDVLVLENQFPCIVLNVIQDALFQHCAELKEEKEEEEEYGENGDISEVENFDESDVRKKELFSALLSFCRLHSPLDIESDASQNSPHILDLMYRLVVIKLSSHEQRWKPAGRRLKEVVGVAAELTGLNSLKFIANLPLEEFFSLFGNENSTTDSSVEEIQIPSVSQLHQVSRIQFEKSVSGRAVRYDEKTRKLYLPVIRLNADSEVILRNLVAYELALGSNENVVSGYVDLMCGLIDTAKDVEFLKEKGIIDTDMPSAEVAKMFNGINKSSSGGVDVLEEAAQKLQETYDGSFRVRCIRFVKNHLIPSEKSVKLVLGILLVLLLTLQAFCQVYGCSAHWFGNITSFASI